MKLHDYQAKAVADIDTAWAAHKRVCLQLSTGGGKTIVGTHIAKQHSSSIFVVDREELLQQTIEKYKGSGIDFGIIAAKHGLDPTKRHYVGTIQTLIRRMEQYKRWNPELLIIDEAHQSVAPSYEHLFEHYPKANVLGLTATPRRLDGRGLDKNYDKLVCGPSTRWLIDNGYLAQPVTYGPKQQMDLKGVHILGGDYKLNELGDAANKATYTGDAIEQYNKLLAGKQAIVFAVHREHAKEVARMFNEAGIPAASLDGTTNWQERLDIVEAFKRQELMVLVNVQLFVMGFDAPDCNGVIDLTPTKSLVRYLQKGGRGMRLKADGSEMIHLDLAGNYSPHGWLDDDREWSLEGRKQDASPERSMAIKCCPTCFRTIRSTEPLCPGCGYEFLVKATEVKVAEGEIVKVERPTTYIKPLKYKSAEYYQLINKATQLWEFQNIARRLGYKLGWGYFRFKEYQERKMNKV